jgi:hypothetical protein
VASPRKSPTQVGPEAGALAIPRRTDAPRLLADDLITVDHLRKFVHKIERTPSMGIGQIPSGKNRSPTGFG